jgi:predicted nucleotidyltransferase
MKISLPKVSLTQVLHQFDPEQSNKYFVFGSSVKGEGFHDIDLGVVGNSSTRKPLSELRERFYDAPIPYKVDVVDFDEADSEFRDYVSQREPLVWIR